MRGSTRNWLKDIASRKNSKAIDIISYIENLESENKRLSAFSPYAEDDGVLVVTESTSSKLFNNRG